MTAAFDARTSQSWWFADQCAHDIQAIVGTGFGRLPAGVALLLFVPPDGGGWLASVDVTTAAERRDGQTHAVTLALTHEGLRRSGLPKAALDRFSNPFREGMTQPDRARRLGDAPPEDDPSSGTLAEAGLSWAGAAPVDAADALPRAPDYGQAHALLLLYAETPETLKKERGRLAEKLAAAQVRIVREIALSPAQTGAAAPREHFGFVDGLSQPFPEDAPGTPEDERAVVVKDPGRAVDAALACHRIRTGDLLFGRGDAYGERPGGIFLDAADAEGLPQGAAPPGQRDFSWNGSFLVARELTQDVARFWREVAAMAEAQGIPAATIAAKMVGRSIDGDLLLPDGSGTDNDVGFATHDPHGFGCPLGSHVRRSNPRDSGARSPEEALTRRDSTNNHRLMRRGRNFGPAAFVGDQGAAGRPPDTATEAAIVDPDARRGLLFMCLNTDIIRQFEFIQQTWLMNTEFGGLSQTDPIVGPAGRFSFPHLPVRRRVPVQTFVRLAGGEYFFLPSQSALTWLSGRTAAHVAADAASRAQRPGDVGNR